jgi:hypothetical protein
MSKNLPKRSNKPPLLDPLNSQVACPVLGSHSNLESVLAAPTLAIHTFVKSAYPTRIPSNSNHAEDSTIICAIEGDDDKDSSNVHPLCFLNMSFINPAEATGLSTSEETSSGPPGRSRTQSNLHRAPCSATASANF